MSKPRQKKQSVHRGSDRHLSVRSVVRDELDVEKIARVVWRQALAEAEAEAGQVPAVTSVDPFVCSCSCNCCKLRRLHDGLCPQPSDEELE